MKRPLLVLVGPTAVGKTAVSVQVAKRLGAEIISGDSMQVYRGMDIGTAKITPAEMDGVPHHLIDTNDPDQPMTVAQFQADVDRLVAEIWGRGRLPMLVGGTGLYVRSVLEEYSFAATDEAVRAELQADADRLGLHVLYERLQQVDPQAAGRIHPNDQRRIVRALEVYQVTGQPISATQTAGAAERRYDDLLIGLSMDRETLYQRIDRRVDLMLGEGWVREVRTLLERYPPRLPAMEGLGYKELVLYLRGQLTYSEAALLIKRNTRRFAKRQMTWFRRESTLKWLDMTPSDSRDQAVSEIVKLSAGKWPDIAESF